MSMSAKRAMDRPSTIDTVECLRAESYLSAVSTDDRLGMSALGGRSGGRWK
jgi:hypothetical protein